MKKLCSYSKEDIKSNFEDLKRKIENPKYVCKKCLRCSNTDEVLCKGEELAE
ncbi:MAG: hypothetical protein NTX05_05030 [Fusobacteria bacterium]|nr:hypothetical protein [Fusobacteriota bacterium]